MPSVKIPRKSTDTDMTPFVDIAFLILSFFIMATKFKPPEPVEITTPGSVLSQKLPENNAVMISIDSSNKVYFSVLSENAPEKYTTIINGINTSQNLGLSPAQIANFRKTFMVGVPFSGLKELLSTDAKDQPKLNQPGIPVLDTLNNQLFWWIRESKSAFAGEKLNYLIKGDGKSKYPVFEAVISALKRNEEFKYNLVTALDDIPSGTELYIKERAGEKDLKK
ncbi:MAG TPA: biopolymer transporter ExbD [Chitinophagaceae bacterium]|nr:biopolymer transporter ExbD [Chitinophagaceae bacterium]HNU13064.1 biopolymer transporter ExbD [Chitinophagaceae bacterium]